MALRDRDYKVADLDNLLSTVKQQWKDFDPLSKEFKDSYTARLNALIKSSGSAAAPDVVSVKPVLVSIERGRSDYYTVTSIRTYVVDLNGRRVTSTKVNSDGVALRGSQLVRLTIQRTLSDPKAYIPLGHVSMSARGKPATFNGTPQRGPGRAGYWVWSPRGVSQKTLSQTRSGAASGCSWLA
jgi:hypothetical protein